MSPCFGDPYFSEGTQMATVFAYEDLVARWADTPREVGEGDRRPADLWKPKRPTMGHEHADGPAWSNPAAIMSGAEPNR